MTTSNPQSALHFLNDAALPEVRSDRGPRARADSQTVLDALDTTKEQAAIVGSEVISFAEGVPGAFRQDLVNGSLLAQLVATKRVPDKTRIFDWYDAYFDALANIGWSVQGRDFRIYVEASQNFDSHKAIISALTAVGAGATAVAMVVSTLEALQSMDEDSPWITLFAKESKGAEGASFQITAVEKGPSGEPFVTLAAFSLQATFKLTQVLFFKVRASDVKLRSCSSKVTINPDVANAVRQPLREKLVGHAADFIKALPDL